MFRVVRFDLLLRYVSYVTVAISVGVYALVNGFWNNALSVFEIVTIASTVSAVLVFLMLSSGVSRFVWWVVALFNKELYPDLNGGWEGVVEMEGGKEFKVRAVIRQTLIFTQIDMHGENVKSVTLETTPTVEQGQKKLYYVYRSTPKDPRWGPYTGATIFDVRRIEEEGGVLELSGNYYTSRKTVGRVRLKQTSTQPEKDVSFY